MSMNAGVLSVSVRSTGNCQEAFRNLKTSLSSAAILAHPQYDQPFILYTDASKIGIGAVLSQVQNGQEKVAEYFSKSLSNLENNRRFTRKGVFVVAKEVEHFHHYLYE